MSPPGTEALTLAEAKAQLRVDIEDDDPVIVAHILAARKYCENLTKRAFIAQTYEWAIDRGWPRVFDSSCMQWRTALQIPLPPLASVISISYVDSSGVTQTLAADQYRVSKGQIYGVVEPAYGVSWPTVRNQLDAITVRFVAGYGTNPGDVPEPIRQAIVLMVKHYYDCEGDEEKPIPTAVAALLSTYMAEPWV